MSDTISDTLEKDVEGSPSTKAVRVAEGVYRCGKTFRIQWEAWRDHATGRRRQLNATMPKGSTVKQAIAERAKRIAAVVNGTHIDPSGLTIREYLPEWNQGRNVTPIVREKDARRIRNDILPHLGNLRLQQLHQRDVLKWHETLRAKPLAPVTVSGLHTLLKLALREAVKVEYVSRNVCEIAGSPYLPDDYEAIEDNEFLRREEAEAVLDAPAAENDLPEREKKRGSISFLTYPLVATALYTGARVGELAALRWKNVDLEAKQMLIEEAVAVSKERGREIKAPKTKAGRRVLALPDDLVEILRALKLTQEQRRARCAVGNPRRRVNGKRVWIFNTADVGSFVKPDHFVFNDIFVSRYDTESWRKNPGVLGELWIRAQKRNPQMPKINFHGFRHTHATLLWADGKDLAEIACRLGHSNSIMTQRIYAHVFHDEARDRRAAESINTLLRGKNDRPTGSQTGAIYEFKARNGTLAP